MCRDDYEPGGLSEGARGAAGAVAMRSTGASTSPTTEQATSAQTDRPIQTSKGLSAPIPATSATAKPASPTTAATTRDGSTLDTLGHTLKRGRTHGAMNLSRVHRHAPDAA